MKRMTPVLLAMAMTLLTATQGWSAAALFSDNFNRADGPLGSSWSSTPFGTLPSIVSNQMCTGVGIEGVAMLAATQFDPAHDVVVRLEGSSTDGDNLKFGVVLANFVGGSPASYAMFEMNRNGTTPVLQIGLNNTVVCSGPVPATFASYPYTLEAQLLTTGDAQVVLRNLNGSTLATASCNIGVQSFQTVVLLQGRNNSTGTTCLDNLNVFGTAATASSCTDGIQNGTETGIDCGGSCPNACATSCRDGLRNGDETGIDCGGSCPQACATCTDGLQNGAESGIDCGGNCPNACATCFDGIQNGTETGIDCGGSCPNACFSCSDGIQNGRETGIDCGGNCSPCQPSCTDGIQNGAETGIDCGGNCSPCQPTCTDGVQNGAETGVDCGGNCSACAPTCTDGIQNGTETGIDCGGSCNACEVTGCSATPLGSCRVALQNLLTVLNSGDDTMDRLAWTWKGGEATALADLDDPSSATNYRFCIYANGANVSNVEIVGGSLCGGGDAPCWKAPMFDAQGYAFRDMAGSQAGINVVKVIAGAKGESYARVSGRGVGLADIAVPLAAPVIVELQNVDTGVCFSSSFAAGDITRSNARRGIFAAKSVLPALP